ncbi:hypothetical protein FAI40_05365 [Acetobacteraceae bacterium]|nr:hypothetical protein FAI40_05365 [Acetobacteraceae bacterium]
MSDLSGQLECGCQEREADYRIPYGRWRRFYVKSLKQESADITSLYLYPVDKKNIPLAKAGQFICIEVEVPGVGPRRRNYSLSSTPSDEYFRISVKEVPDGLVSPLLTRKVKAGDEFEVSGPYGEFFSSPVISLLLLSAVDVALPRLFPWRKKLPK